MHIPRVDTVVPSTTMTTTSVVVRTTSPPPYDTSPPRAPILSELIISGNDKATFQIKQRRGRLCFQEGEDDEDMATTVTPISPAVFPLGTIASSQICQLNYQVLSFLGNVSSVHENMMLPNLDTFVLLAIEGPSTDKKDEHWSLVKHGDEGACEENNNRGSSGDFRTLKPS